MNSDPGSACALIEDKNESKAAIAAKFFLKENVDRRRWLAVLFVAAGVFLDPEKLHAINHVGEHFKVAGPLNLARSKQGQPVIFQAGVSEDGRNLAAHVAEGIFSPGESFESSREYYADATAASTPAEQAALVDTLRHRSSGAPGRRRLPRLVGNSGAYHS